ncbi:protein FAR1-RELATED SEQUENCE 6-like [Papaver somniferum]|uniref:protein FAR1-RELATED SEQUENCE 6-like n=1 Tax=Papaver somniferum TaxID=3469 RepID=UPI000E6F8320|nr:protein FAR1-RELATED SEQUENCE 6-like [Papaver somniferum]
MVVAEFTLSNLTVSHAVSESTTVSEMISVVKQYWPYVPEDLVLFCYTVDGISHVINHDLELRFFIDYCISKGIGVLKFNIQFKICVDSVPSSSSYSVAPSLSSSSCVSNNDVAIVEDLTDDSSLVKRVPKKSDAWANILTGVGQVFESKNDYRDTVKKYEFHSGYKLDVRKSDKKRYTVECKNKESQNCSWRFHASVVAKTKGVFQCKKFRGEHTCDLASSDPAKVRMMKSFPKDILMDEFRASKKKKTAADVQDLLHLEYGIDLNVPNFEYDGVTKQFQRFFVAFEASITGFNNYCRLMLFIDCTFLTGKFKGGLMVACGKTGNQEIYLVAFGIVPCESCESWEWFLTNLKGIIKEDRPLTIISDRGAGFLKHVHVIFPKAYHSYCLYHMKGNIPVPKGKSRQTDVKLFEECYTFLTKEKFYAAAKSMSNLKLDSVIDWMVKIPFQNWESHAFQGERFGENTLKIAESFNSVIKHDKRLPSLDLVDCIRAKVVEQNYKRLVESSKWTSNLTPRMQARLNKRVTDCLF